MCDPEHMATTSAGDSHSHRLGSAGSRRSALALALVANAAFMLVEVVGGIVFSSIALVADGVHMASDVAALIIALAVIQLPRNVRQPTRTPSDFGAAEVIGAAINVALLYAACAWLAYESVSRFAHAESPDVGPVAAIVSIGLVINLFSAYVLWRQSGSNSNVRAAFAHMATDAAGSAVVLVAMLARSPSARRRGWTRWPRSPFRCWWSSRPPPCFET